MAKLVDLLLEADTESEDLLLTVAKERQVSHRKPPIIRTNCNVKINTITGIISTIYHTRCTHMYTRCKCGNVNDNLRGYQLKDC